MLTGLSASSRSGHTGIRPQSETNTPGPGGVPANEARTLTAYCIQLVPDGSAVNGGRSPHAFVACVCHVHGHPIALCRRTWFVVFPDEPSSSSSAYTSNAP